MKCPKCSHNHKKSLGMTCGSCGYRFVFHPTGDGMTDGRFQAILAKASENDTCYFTFNRLYSAYSYIVWKKNKTLLALIAFAVAAAVILAFAQGVKGFFLGLGIGAVLVVVYVLKPWTPPDPEKLRGYLRRWTSRGAVEKLIESPRLGQPPPDYPESDIYDYGVEKLLVVDDDLLVDYFVLNGLHSRERALVVSASGYPDYLVARALEALEASPRMPVYFLHGTAPSARPGWLPAEVRRRMIDLGLFPGDVKKMKSLRHLGPEREGTSVPVDAFAYGSLAAMLGASFLADGIVLADVVAMQRESGEQRGSYG